MVSSSMLTSTQKYAAGALFTLALRQAQIHQTFPGLSLEAEVDGYDALNKSHMWGHERYGLLRSVFRFLEIDSQAWMGIEETANFSPASNHVDAYLKLLLENAETTSQEMLDEQIALIKAIDAMVQNLEALPLADEEQCDPDETSVVNKRHSLQNAGKQFTVAEVNGAQNFARDLEKLNCPHESHYERPFSEKVRTGYARKTAVLFVLVSACVANAVAEDGKTPLQEKNRYDARHRVALRLLASWLGIDSMEMVAIEIIVACAAAAMANNDNTDAKELPAKNTWSSWKRGGIIGAAALTGGALLALTGGLAAPAIAAGFGALAPTLGTLVPVIGASGFAAAASAAGTVAGSVAVAASFGAAGAGLTGTKMARRTGNLKEFNFLPFGECHSKGRLAVGIFISGLVYEQSDFITPWDCQKDNMERYALQWESDNLIALSTAISDWITSRLTIELMKQGAMVTVLSTLLTALAWPATLLAATDFIDSKWSIAIDRSDKAGKLLAEVLVNGLHGNRPVTLCGFSLGARVIFKCLQHLAESGKSEGIVERVVLLGSPVSLDGEDWECARKVVAGRFVNAYSTNDWMLGVAFRASLLSRGLAGIQPVDVPGIENVDVTKFVEGHSSYLSEAKRLLPSFKIDSCYPLHGSISFGDLQRNGPEASS